MSAENEKGAPLNKVVPLIVICGFLATILCTLLGWLGILK